MLFLELKVFSMIKLKLLHLENTDWTWEDHLRSCERMIPRSRTDSDCRMGVLSMKKLVLNKPGFVLENEMWSDLVGWIFNCQLEHQRPTVLYLVIFGVQLNQYSEA